MMPSTHGESLFPTFMSDVKVPLKYRQPGFYEIKEHGFEYRSLPFTDDVFDHIVEIVYSSFKLFDEI